VWQRATGSLWSVTPFSDIQTAALVAGNGALWKKFRGNFEFFLDVFTVNVSVLCLDGRENANFSVRKFFIY
jgi:hypothetical protein